MVNRKASARTRTESSTTQGMYGAYFLPAQAMIFHELPVELQPLIDLDDPDLTTICDSIKYMRAAGIDVTTPEGLALAIKAGRQRVLDLNVRAATEPIHRWTDEELRAEEERRADIIEARSVVYYARIGNRCKIGFSSDVVRRMSELCIEQLLATEPGGLRIEGQRHQQFRDLWTHSEWFRLEDPLVEHIQQLRQEQGRDPDWTTGA